MDFGCHQLKQTHNSLFETNKTTIKSNAKLVVCRINKLTTHMPPGVFFLSIEVTPTLSEWSRSHICVLEDNLRPILFCSNLIVILKCIAFKLFTCNNYISCLKYFHERQHNQNGRKVAFV